MHTADVVSTCVLLTSHNLDDVSACLASKFPCKAISLSSPEHEPCSEVESGRRSVRSTGDDSIAQNLFERLPGVPLEQAYVSDVITIEWFGNRCHPDSTQSLYRRVTNRCDLNSSGTVKCDVTDTQLYILVVVRLGPVRRESPPSTRSNRARPASLSSLHPEQSSDAARHVVPVQQCADSRHPSPSSGRTAVGS